VRPTLLISCEHGGNRVPREYRPLFTRLAAALASHRGYDIGALALARGFASTLRAPLFYSTISRLLVDLNRSPRHPHLFSEATRALPPEGRQRLLARYYFPYRVAIESQVRRGVDEGRRVIHLSCHSFTPVLEGERRHLDVGLLYDPGRPAETRLCGTWRETLRHGHPALAVRRNQPYRGVADGLTSYLRRRFPASRYVGIELEVNQRFPLGHPGNVRAWRALRRLLVQSYAEALAEEGALPGIPAGAKRTFRASGRRPAS
jgi:predicted N-formylglutamate amidohydrolase